MEESCPLDSSIAVIMLTISHIFNNMHTAINTDLSTMCVYVAMCVIIVHPGYMYIPKVHDEYHCSKIHHFCARNVSLLGGN